MTGSLNISPEYAFTAKKINNNSPTNENNPLTGYASPGELVAAINIPITKPRTIPTTNSAAVRSKDCIA